jgi:hypothetical protein
MRDVVGAAVVALVLLGLVALIFVATWQNA